MKKFQYIRFCNSISTSLYTLRVNAIRWLMLAALAFAAQTQAQSNDPADAEMKELMKLLESDTGPSASGLGARESIPGIQAHLRALIAEHGAQSPQVANQSRYLANTQKKYADELFKEGKFREALPLYQEVLKERESRTGSNSGEAAASRNDVAKTLEQLKRVESSAK